MHRRLCLLLLPFVLVPLRAADSIEERLRALESKVDALQKENAELRQALDASQAERPVAPRPAPTPGNGHSTDVSAIDRLAPAGKETRLAIGGYTQAQAEFGGTGDARYLGTNDRFFFRRARIGVSGSFAEHFEFKVEGEFGAGSNSATTGLRATMNDTYIGWNRFPSAVVRFGQLKSAFSGELLTAEYKGALVERSLGAERIGDGRQIGMDVGGDFLNHRLGYLVFVGNGNGSNTSANDNNHFLRSARVYGVAFDHPAAGKLTLGADAFHSTDTAFSKLGPGFDNVPGGALDNLFTGTRDAWGVDTAWHYGLFDFMTELLRARYRPVNAIPDRSFESESWQFTASYFLVPKYFQAAARREHFDPNLSRSGDATNNWVLGLDCYIRGEDLKFMADYVFGHAPGLPDNHGRLRTRFQIVY